VLVLLDRVLARLRSLKPDVLVCTGDLLDYPLDQMGDGPTQEQARRDLLAIREALGRLECPTLAIPGNHDHPQIVWEVFADVSRDSEAAGLRFLLFDDREDAEHVPHRRGGERRRLDSALSDGDSPPQVHVQHFLVWPERNEGYPHTYAEGHDLTDELVNSGRVRLVLSGHYHEGVRPARLGDTWFSTAPAFCEPPFPIWIYDLVGTHVNWQQITLERPEARGNAGPD